jgi:outer membrane lipoprotein-sorting protein
MALTKIPSSLLDTASGLDLQGNITLGDNEQILLGDSSDLAIYHSGAHSFITDSGTGDLIIQGSNAIRLRSSTGENMAIFNADGAATLQYDNLTKITTSSTGATVTGTLTVTGDLDITGNVNSYNVTDLDVTDQTITLGAGQTEANSGGSGIIIDGSNASILWDETNDVFDFNKGLTTLGNVGIGTTSPNTTLTLSNGTDEFDFGVTTNQLLIKSVTSDGSDDQRIIIDAGSGGLSSTRGAFLALSGNEASSEAGKAIYQMGNVTGSAHVFRKAGGDDAVTINSSGNVGIGTDDPQQLLHINAASPNILLSGTSFPALKFSGSDNTTDAEIYYGVGASDWNFNNYNNGRTVFKNNNVETVRINADGSVGIGTLGDASFASGSGLEIQRAGIATLRLQNTSGKSVEITQDSDFKIECINSSSDIHLIPTSFVGVGTETPDSTLHVKGTSQLNLLKIERASSTPGITFVNGADTAGTFGFQLMDRDEWWAGVYDGSNYLYWIQANQNVLRVTKPVASSTDSGTRQYSHLCTGSFYSSTGAIVIDTNIPAHDDSSGNANMFSIKIRGFEYAIHGSIDLNVGCYAGENNYYSANYNSNYIADGWRGNIKFAKNDTTGKLAIILGTTSTAQRCELAVVDFIQGFQNVNESYAYGWSMSVKTSLSNYSNQTDMSPRHQSPRPGYHAYLTSSTALSSGVQQPLFTSTTFNEGGHYNTSTGKFTAPTEGVYQFNFALQLNSSTVNQRYLSAEAIVNDSTKYIGGWFNKTTGANNNDTTYGAATGSALIKLARNDYVEFQCELFAGDTALGGQPGYTYISGILVG